MSGAAPHTLRTALVRVVDVIEPASGAVVMGTGIVAIDLQFADHPVLWLIPLAIAIAAWVALAALLPIRAAAHTVRFVGDARAPASLTGVAGTGVLGAAVTLLGRPQAGIAFLLIALAAWLVLMPLVLRHWRRPTAGASFMITVATESLSVLAGAIATRTGTAWLVVAAAVALALGVLLYGFVIATFDWRQLLTGQGDHWVAGGALAISALACATTAASARSLNVLGDGSGALDVTTLVLWGAAMLWLPPLLAGELLRPRLRYDVARWATVFPLGMYAACSFLTGTAVRLTSLARFATVWTDVATAVWGVVLAAAWWQAIKGLRAAATFRTVGDRH